MSYFCKRKTFLFDNRGAYQLHLRAFPWFLINLPTVYRASMQMPFFVLCRSQFLKEALNGRQGCGIVELHDDVAVVGVAMHLYATCIMVELETVSLASHFHPQHVGWHACILLDLKSTVGLPYYSANEGEDDFVDVVSMIVSTIHNSFEILLKVTDVAYF